MLVGDMVYFQKKEFVKFLNLIRFFLDKTRQDLNRQKESMITIEKEKVPVMPCGPPLKDVAR